MMDNSVRSTKARMGKVCDQPYDVLSKLFQRWHSVPSIESFARGDRAARGEFEHNLIDLRDDADRMSRIPKGILDR